MNSNQRRKAKRDLELNYTHSVRLEIGPVLRYFEWEARLRLIEMWCKSYLRSGWKQKFGFNSATFYFTQGQHAMLFALKWS
jgi:hypothetical protein